MRAFSPIDQINDMPEYHINKCILDTLTICSSKFKDTRIHIEKQLREVPPVNCNAGDINQVILNLLMNAMDAILMKNPEGMGSIKILTCFDARFVCFHIKDDGIGIPEPLQSKIFEPFYTTKQVGEGTGLGLSLCYDIIIKKHHGEILLQSSPGAGSEFIIKLPR